MSIIGPYGYSGGLNADASILTLPKGQLSAFQNMQFNQGILGPIAGFDIANIPQPPTGLSLNYVSLLGGPISSAEYLFVSGLQIGQNKTYYLKNFTGSWTDITPSGGGAFFDGQWCIDFLNNVAIIGAQTSIFGSSLPNGAGYQWNGTGSLVALSSPSGVGLFRTVNNFMIGLKSDGTIYWSNVGDPTTWTAGNSIVFRPGDGDCATAIGKIGNNAYPFKLNSIGCLQTNSVVISGSVVLGPLYTIFDKIGTFSMQTLDNLPTGEIVFLGSDYNVYRFDGSSLTNLSRRPYPQSSVQSIIDNFMAANSGITGNHIWLRVDPMEHCFYLNFGGYTNFNTVSNTLGLTYDYVNDVWATQTNPWNNMVFMNLVGNIGGFIPDAIQNLFIGLDISGGVYSISNSYTHFWENQIVSSATVSIPYTFESRETIPRSAIIPYSGDNGDTITITPSFDGVAGSSVSANPSGASILNRQIIPLNFVDSTMSIQINMSFSSLEKFSINPIVLDTEIAH